MIGSAAAQRNDVVDFHLRMWSAARRASLGGADCAYIGGGYLSGLSLLGASVYPSGALNGLNPIWVGLSPLLVVGLMTFRVLLAPCLRSFAALLRIGRVGIALLMCAAVNCGIVCNALYKSSLDATGVLFSPILVVLAQRFAILIAIILLIGRVSVRIVARPLGRACSGFRHIGFVKGEAPMALLGVLRSTFGASAVDHSARSDVTLWARIACEIRALLALNCFVSADDVHRRTITTRVRNCNNYAVA